MNAIFSIISLLIWAIAQIDPAWAVVRIPSHGCSGTVIATGQGWTRVLTCGHAFTGSSRHKRLMLDCPSPSPGQPQQANVRLVDVDYASDLALLHLDHGPMPYVVQVAAARSPNRLCWSIGYDEMAAAPVKRQARIASTHGATTWTHERPWHGRSGGPLVEQASGCLVGVVSGYTGPSNRVEVFPGAYGVYVSLEAVTAFLGKRSPGPKLEEQRQHRHIGLPPAPLPIYQCPR